MALNQKKEAALAAVMCLLTIASMQWHTVGVAQTSVVLEVVQQH